MANKKFLIPWIISLAIMVLIFVFSACPGDVSGGMSEKITLFLLNIFNPDYASMDASVAQIVFESWHHIVRKCAHFCIYLCLGASFMVAFYATPVWTNNTNRIRALKSMPSALGFSILYAISDEFHQSFIAGRTALFTDVLIDSAGALVGIFIAGAILHLIDRAHNKKAQN